MNELNPTTTGMDGGDCPAWHDEQHEIDAYAVVAVAVLAGVLLAVMATTTTLPPVLLQPWQIAALLSVAAGVGFFVGVVTMALAAAASYSEQEAGE